MQLLILQSVCTCAPIFEVFTIEVLLPKYKALQLMWLVFFCNKQFLNHFCQTTIDVKGPIVVCRP